MTHVRTTFQAPRPHVRAAKQAVGIGVARGWAAAFARGLSLIPLWAARRRQRRALALLDIRLLSDVGLSPEDVARECAKPFWRA